MKKGFSSISHLIANDTLITDKQQVADLLTSNTFKKSRSEKKIFWKFSESQRNKGEETSWLLYWKHWRLRFTILAHRTETVSSKIKRCCHWFGSRSLSILNPLIRLPDTVLCTLLQIYNELWESSSFLPSWLEAFITDIPKPGKDTSAPINYRPVALTRCLCKTMEIMVSARPMWSLETQGLLSEIITVR